MAEIGIVDLKQASMNGGGAVQIDDREYHRDPCPGPSLSKGILALLLNASAAHAHTAHPRLNLEWKPDDVKRHTVMGSACHSLMLGRGSDLVEIQAENYRTKAAQQQRDDAISAGRVPILPHQLELARTIVAAGYDQLRARGLGELSDGGGDAEVAVLHQIEPDIWLRILLDWWADDRLVVVDYKTTEGLAAPQAFARRAAQFDYDLQDAFYSFVLGAQFPELAGRLRFLFAVQEMEPPFALTVCEIAEADRAVAMRKVEVGIRLWSECLRANRWPGYSIELQRITLPPWHNAAWIEGELSDEFESSRAEV